MFAKQQRGGIEGRLRPAPTLISGTGLGGVDGGDGVLHPLWSGDLLIIRDKDTDESLWEGIVEWDNSAGSQHGIDPGIWKRWFTEGHRAWMAPGPGHLRLHA